MGSAKKIGLITISILLLVVLALILALPYLLDLDEIRKAAEEEATKALGRQVTISRVGLSLFPSPAVRLEEISVSAVQGAGNVSEVSVSSVELGVAWSEIIRAPINVGEVTIVDPGITFLLDPEGAWTLMEKGELVLGSLLSVVHYASGAALKKDFPLPVSMTFKEVQIRGAEVVVRDPSGKMLKEEISISNIYASFNRDSLDGPLRFTASLHLPGSESRVTANGTVGPFEEETEPASIPLEIYGKAENLDLDNFSIPAVDIPLVLSGTFHSEGTFSGTLEEGFAFRQEAGFKEVQIFSDTGFPFVKDLMGSLGQKGHVNLVNKSIELDRFEFTAGDAQFSASGTVAHNGVLPRFDVRYESNRIELADFVRYFPDLEKRVLLKGDLTVKGSAEGTLSKDLSASMDMASTLMEMDRGPLLLKRKSDQDRPSAGEQELMELLPPSLPMTVSATISVPRGRFEWVQFSDLMADIRIKNRWASLDRMAFSAFGGHLKGSSWFNMRKLPATYGTDFSIRDMEIDRFLTAFAGLKGVMYGKASLDLFVSGRGANMDQFKETTLGLGKFDIASGKYTPANFLKGALEAASLPTSKAMPDLTEFDTMESTIAVRGGKMDFTGLTCTAEDWVLDGSGIIGLDQSVSLRYFMTLSDSVASAIGTEGQKRLTRDSQGRLQIPFKLSGTFTSPEFSFDHRAMEKVAAN